MTPGAGFDLSKLRGDEAEAFAARIRGGIMAGTVEVKRDDRAHRTGNFYFEQECRFTGRGWQRSGIADSHADHWAIVAWPLLIVTDTWAARYVIRDGKRVEQPNGSHPTRGVVLPVGEYVRRLIWSPAL